MILLDTHALIWFTRDERLGKQSQKIADAALAENCLAFSAISLWEIALLVARHRLRSIDSATEVRSLLRTTGLIELPLTGDIAIRSVDLGNLPGDPADRFIVATAMAHDATLMTADVALLAWPSELRRQNALH